MKRRTKNMKNFKLDKLNRRSVNCAEFMQPAKYIAKNFIVDSEGKFFTGISLEHQQRYVAEYMKMGADLVKGKYWWSGLVIGVVGTIVVGTYLELKEESEESKEA
jgi:predicted acetyltransferase